MYIPGELIVNSTTTSPESCTVDVACSLPVSVYHWSNDSAATNFKASMGLSSNGGASVHFPTPYVNVTSNAGSFSIDGVVFKNFTGSDPSYSVTVRPEASAVEA